MTFRNHSPAPALPHRSKAALAQCFCHLQLKLEAVMGNLLYWALAFLVVALIAAALGFGGVAGTAMSGAQILFWVAIVLFVVSALIGLFRRRT